MVLLCCLVGDISSQYLEAPHAARLYDIAYLTYKFVAGPGIPERKVGSRAQNKFYENTNRLFSFIILFLPSIDELAKFHNYK
jgi:hypothetical protein